MVKEKIQQKTKNIPYIEPQIGLIIIVILNKLFIWRTKKRWKTRK